MVCARRKLRGGIFTHRVMRARSAAPLGCLASPRLLASGHHSPASPVAWPMYVLCAPAACTWQVLVCPLRSAGGSGGGREQGRGAPWRPVAREQGSKGPRWVLGLRHRQRCSKRASHCGQIYTARRAPLIRSACSTDLALCVRARGLWLVSLRESVEVRMENGFGVPRPPQTPTGTTLNPPAPRGRRLEGNRVQRSAGSPRCGRAAAVARPAPQARSTGLGGT
jgi:hypothetical protein